MLNIIKFMRHLFISKWQYDNISLSNYVVIP